MQASRDENNIPTLIGVSEMDGETILKVAANPTTHRLLVNINTTGSDMGRENPAYRDENNVPVLMGVSEVDGITPVMIYVDNAGRLLVDYN